MTSRDTKSAVWQYGRLSYRQLGFLLTSRACDVLVDAVADRLPVQRCHVAGRRLVRVADHGRQPRVRRLRRPTLPTAQRALHVRRGLQAARRRSLDRFATEGPQYDGTVSQTLRLTPTAASIKHPVPDRVKPSFEIFDIRAL